MLSTPRLFRERARSGRWFRVAALLLMLVLGLSVRLVHITALPYDFHVDRQYFDALRAQADYDNDTGAPALLRREADANVADEGALEPPIMQQLAVWGYEIDGHEDLTIAFVEAAVIWVIGAIFLYLLVARLLSLTAAFVAAAFYLFAPFGVAASRAFMPDPLMVTMAVLAVYVAMRYHQAGGRRRGLLAASFIAAAAAIWVKPMAVFVVVPAFAAFELSAKGWRRAALSPALLAFLVGAGAPPGAFYLYEYLSGSFQKGAGTVLSASIFLHVSFWHGWIENADTVLRVGPWIPGEAVIVLSFIAVLVSRQPTRTLLLALAAGYFALGVVFATHIYNHDYYSLPLIPIVAIALGSLGSWALDRLHAWRPVLAKATPAAMVVAFAAYAGYSGGALYNNFSTPQPQVPSVTLDRHIGGVVDHSTRVMFLAQNYGLTVAYYGCMTAETHWPNSSDLASEKLLGHGTLSVPAQMDQIVTRFHPQWFVITWPSQLRLQPKLPPFLEEHFVLAAHGSTYWVYDLRVPASGTARLEG